jgi:hypothetical protein
MPDTSSRSHDGTRADFMVLKEAVEQLHGCEANYITSEHVRETLGDTVLFDGGVSLFGLAGHPAATMCYAWSTEATESPDRKVYAVLRLDPVDTSRDAVRASLALKRSDLT